MLWEGQGDFPTTHNLIHVSRKSAQFKIGKTEEGHTRSSRVLSSQHCASAKRARRLPNDPCFDARFTVNVPASQQCNSIRCLEVIKTTNAAQRGLWWGLCSSCHATPGALLDISKAPELMVRPKYCNWTDASLIQKFLGCKVMALENFTWCICNCWWSVCGALRQLLPDERCSWM